MKSVRSRLTYANVMSSLAVFLLLGGATAFAAGHLGRNSVGAKQLKKNAVTAAKIRTNAVTASKIKDGSVTGAAVADGSLGGGDVNAATLGTVPSAASANGLAGRTPFSLFFGPGTLDVAKVGPFTIRAQCRINNGGKDEVELFLLSAVNGVAMDDNSGDEEEDLKAGEEAELFARSIPTGQAEIEANSEGGLGAVAPEGTGILTHGETLGLNLVGHPGQCYAGGVIEKIA